LSNNARSLKRLIAIWLRQQDYWVKGEAKPRMSKWTLFGTRWVQVYIHRFNGADWTTDPHDHPSSFLSIGLMGSYVESVYNERGEKLYDREWRAPWIRTFPATHIHRTSAVGPKGACTLCVVGDYARNWNFLVGREIVPWRDYMKRYRLTRMDVTRSRTPEPIQPHALPEGGSLKH
jgi:hypothetical protein